MAVSEFLPFATTVGANVETQTEFASDPALGPGYATGRVYSRKLNKLWRQSSFVSAAIARMILEQLSQDVLDNGNLTDFTTNLTQAIKNIGSSVPIHVSDSPPSAPFIGQLWFDTTTANMLYIYFDGYWIPGVNQKGGSGNSGSSVFVSDSPPSNPFVGQLWFDTTTANMLYVYYDGYWIPALNQNASSGSFGGSVFVSDSPPPNPFIGQLWFDAVTANMLYLYFDGFWIPALNQQMGPGSSGATVFVSESPPPAPFIGQLWFDAATANMLYVFFDGYWIPAINQPGAKGATGAGVDYPEQTVLTPVTGATVAVPIVSKVILNPAAILASLTLQMPDAADKRTIRISTRQRIDSLAITGLGGRTVDWATGELPTNGIIDLTLVASLNAWVRA
jgi:hypothetical protein